MWPCYSELIMHLAFGYYPRTQEIRTSNIAIAPLDEIDTIIAQVSSSELVESRWFYAPPQRVTGRERPRPYSTRVFGLRNTHRFEHLRSDDLLRLRFLMHCLGFFEGMRFDDTAAGFLDATPVAQGMLNDFFIYRQASTGLLNSPTRSGNDMLPGRTFP
jgi:putative SOS response-associated peptidase YedK